MFMFRTYSLMFHVGQYNNVLWGYKMLSHSHVSILRDRYNCCNVVVCVCAFCVPIRCACLISCLRSYYFVFMIGNQHNGFDSGCGTCWRPFCVPTLCWSIAQQAAIIALLGRDGNSDWDFDRLCISPVEQPVFEQRAGMSARASSKSWKTSCEGTGGDSPKALW